MDLPNPQGRDVPRALPVIAEVEEDEVVVGVQRSSPGQHLTFRLPGAVGQHDRRGGGVPVPSRDVPPGDAGAVAGGHGTPRGLPRPRTVGAVGEGVEVAVRGKVVVDRLVGPAERRGWRPAIAGAVMGSKDLRSLPPNVREVRHQQDEREGHQERDPPPHCGAARLPRV